MVSKLEGAEREAALKEVPSWKVVDGRDAIHKEYKFADFKEAFAWMTKVADVAEEVRSCNHHCSTISQSFNFR